MRVDDDGGNDSIAGKGVDIRKNNSGEGGLNDDK